MIDEAGVGESWKTRASVAGSANCYWAEPGIDDLVD